MVGCGKGRIFPAVFLMAAAAVAAFCPPGLAAMTLSPYLQAVTTNGVYVLIECDSTEPVTVEYGPTQAYGGRAVTGSVEATNASPSTYVHNVRLTGLLPGTAYHYRAAQADTFSADRSFMTAVEPGMGFRFAWMADCRSQPEIHNEIAGRIREKQPAFSLYGGDLCQRGEDYGLWKSEFFVPNQVALAAEVPFFNAVGNHEAWSANTQAFTQAPDSASGTQAYYSFDYGDAHFVCVNNELPYAPGSPQFDFVAKDLAATRKAWKIVFSHRPAYSLGGHSEDPGMQQMTAAVLEPRGVDLVIGGHNHYYQHNLVNGLHHLVIGTAGAPFVSHGVASYTLKAVRDYSFAVADVTATSLRMVVYNKTGTVLDNIELSKGKPPVPPAPPVAPTGLRAQAGPGQVTLTWQPSAWATSYKVKRGTKDTGPFVVLGDKLTANTFTDTTAGQGTYYYVVSAVNAKGESQDCRAVMVVAK